MITGFTICIYWRETKAGISRMHIIIHISHIIISGISIFIQLNIERRQPVFLSQNKTSNLELSVFLNKIYKKNIIIFPQTKEITEIGQPNFSPQNIPYVILIKKIITYSTWDMSKSQSIYMWENVNSLIQIIESRIDFNSKTTD